MKTIIYTHPTSFKKLFLLFIVLLWGCQALPTSQDSQSLSPQGVQTTGYYVAYFTDKEGTPYRVDMPSAFLSMRAIKRRQKNSFETVVADLPVSPAYVRAVNAISGASVVATSKWTNSALVLASSAVGRTNVSSLPEVRELVYMAPQGRPSSLSDISRRKLSSTSRPLGPAYGPHQGSTLRNAVQNTMLGADDMHAAGMYGKGTLVAVLDAGFPAINTLAAFSHLRTNNRIIDTYSFVLGESNVYHNRSGSHGEQVLSTMAARVAATTGDGLSYEGIAPEASYALYETEDIVYEMPIEEYYWLLAAERADSIGADIIQSSLGYRDFDLASRSYSASDLNGRTALVTRAAEMAYERGIIVVVAVGNSGPGARTLGAPSDGANVIAAGGLNGMRGLVGFSSRGPSGDNRIKPDLVAMAASTLTVSPSGRITPLDGTSFSSPLISALTAGIIGRYCDQTNTEIVNALKEGATALPSSTSMPNNNYGHGIPTYLGTINALSTTSTTTP